MRAAALMVAALALAPPARADDRAPALHRDAAAQFGLTLPAGWRVLPARAGVPIAAADADGAVTLTVSRLDHPNPGAWRGRERFFAAVERGALATLDAPVRKSRRVHRVGPVPALDLELVGRRGGARQRLLMRFLFFRRYSLVLTIAGDAPTVRRARRQLDRARDSFAPYLEPSSGSR